MKDFIEPLAGTSLEEPLNALDALYADADAATSAWISDSRIACPPGCGACCERFVPDILPVEALYLAAWARKNAPEAIERVSAFDGTMCPLYVKDNPHHCTVYGGRPLICRMFGYSGMKDKDGNAAFSLCFAMSHPSGLRKFTSEETVREFGKTPPVMADYGMATASILPDSAGKRSLLPFALADAAARIETILRYASR